MHSVNERILQCHSIFSLLIIIQSRFLKTGIRACNVHPHFKYLGQRKDSIVQCTKNPLGSGGLNVLGFGAECPFLLGTLESLKKGNV
jgi:hypothetical protein